VPKYHSYNPLILFMKPHAAGVDRESALG